MFVSAVRIAHRRHAGGRFRDPSSVDGMVLLTQDASRYRSNDPTRKLVDP